MKEFFVFISMIIGIISLLASGMIAETSSLFGIIFAVFALVMVAPVAIYSRKESKNE